MNGRKWFYFLNEEIEWFKKKWMNDKKNEWAKMNFLNVLFWIIQKNEWEKLNDSKKKWMAKKMNGQKWIFWIIQKNEY